MEANKFLDILEALGDKFYAGVPDSLLSPFIDCLMNRYGISDRHIVAANEGAAVGLAAGHYLATGRPGIVYMQNSGIGNAVNPICSLLHDKVYAIPVIFVIGWRGEPGTKDEPQHIFQGESTLSMLDCVEVPYIVVSDDSCLDRDIEKYRQHLINGRSVAFVIRKGALSNDVKIKYSSKFLLSREYELKTILDISTDEDIFVCTTGKLSREVFELREKTDAGHGHDFLTVGSMGHSLMIAHGIASAKPAKRIWCLDGDGAMLMHMGSLTIVGTHSPKNLVHVVINNGAHETVGGVPAVSGKLNLCEIARASGYGDVFRVSCEDELNKTLGIVREKDGPIFIEIMCNLTSRSDLGRPTTSPRENRDALMDVLKR